LAPLTENTNEILLMPGIVQDGFGRIPCPSIIWFLCALIAPAAAKTDENKSTTQPADRGQHLEGSHS